MGGPLPVLGPSPVVGLPPVDRPMAGGTPAVVLLLADGRFPAGGHAHSGGMEQAVSAGTVAGPADLQAWTTGVLWTVGLTAAGLAAAGCALGLAGGPGAGAGRRDSLPRWARLQSEADARLPSAAQRTTSCRLGRQLVRSAGRVWPGPLLEALAGAWPDGLHHALALGAVTAAGGGLPADAALVAAFTTAMTPVGAAVRLLGIDPVEATAIVGRLGPAVQTVAAEATAAATGPLRNLPARSAPLLDYLAEHHHRRQGRLFAS